MYEIWDDRIEQNAMLRRCRRRQLKPLATACLEHAFLVQHAYYQPRVEPRLLQTLREVLGRLWKSCRAGCEMENATAYITMLETGFTDDAEDTGPLIHGFQTLLSGAISALEYFAKSNAKRDLAVEVMGNAYFAVAQEAMQAYLEEHPLPSPWPERYKAAQQIEYNSEKCVREIEFQEACIAAVVRGEELRSRLGTFPHDNQETNT